MRTRSHTALEAASESAANQLLARVHGLSLYPIAPSQNRLSEKPAAAFA